MKIAIDISQIAYEGSGVASYTKGLVENLLKIDRENEYIIFGFSLRQIDAFKKYFDSLIDLNNKVKAKYFPIPQTLGNFLWNRFHLFNIETLLGEIDIYHSSDWLQLPSKKAKKVTTVHDMVVFKYPQTSHPYIIETQKRRLFWVKKECDLVVCDSEATRKDLMKYLRMGEEKLTVVYPGINDIYSPKVDEEITRIKQKYELMDDYILFVGTNEPRKNLENVLLAFKIFLRHQLIKSRKNPIELIIVGKEGWGDMDAQIRSKLKDVKYVKKLGLVAEQDMPVLYSGASLFLYPSLYEGFGLPVVEAMRCGCPVITSERGSLKELSAGAALMVDPEMPDDIAIAMTKMLIDEKLRSEYARKGKENAAKFTWETTAKQILSSYKKLFFS